MVTMIKTGHSKILGLFYENKKISFHLREIARKTRLYANSATRFLNQLEKEGLLTSQREGNLKRYKINEAESAFFHNINSFYNINRL